MRWIPLLALLFACGSPDDDADPLSGVSPLVGAPTGTGTGQPTGTGTGQPTGTGTGQPTGTGTGQPTGTGTGQPTGTGTGQPTGTGTGQPTGTGTGQPTGTGTGQPTGTGTGQPTGTGTGQPTGTGTGAGPLDQDGDGFDALVDCNDNDPLIFPGNPEICDGLDNDCAGGVDDGLVFTDWFGDQDGDGFGHPASGQVNTCDGPPLGYGADGDCDDNNAAVFPGNPELCDGLDNDCAGGVDDGLVFVNYSQDLDGDGWGAGIVTATCDGPPPGLGTDGDCDDGDPLTHPGAATVGCDWEDRDCDGQLAGDQVVPDTANTVQLGVGLASAGDLVCVRNGFYPENVSISKELGLEGESRDYVVIDAGGAGRAIDVNNQNGGRVTISTMTVQNGLSADGAGLRGWAGDLTVLDVTIQDNLCTTPIAFYCEGVGFSFRDGVSDLVMESVEISDNTATHEAIGVGAYVDAGSALLDRMWIEGNVADGTAGCQAAGLYLNDTTTELIDSSIVGNHALNVPTITAVGLTAFGDLTMRRTRIVDNTGTGALLGQAVGVFAIWGDMVFENVIVSGNYLEFAPGGFSPGATTIQTTDMTLTATNMTVAGNVTVGASQVTTASWQPANVDSVLRNISFDQNLDFSGTGGGPDVIGGTYDIAYCNSWNNSYANWTGISDPTGTNGNISVDPMYITPLGAYPQTWDLHLQGGSGLIDAGDPGLGDVDGSVSDIGAYGGPNGGW